MSPRRILCLIRKEFLQLRRDPVALRVTLVAPILQLVLLGYAATLDARNIPTVVCDLDDSAQSRALIRSVLESGYFSEVGRAARPEDATVRIDEGEALVALVIPADFGGRLEDGSGVAVQAMVDGSNSNEATTAIGHLSGVVLNQAIETAVKRLPAGTLGPRGGPPLEAEMRVRYNETMQSSHYMVPGVIGLILLVTTMLLTSLAVTREKEIGTIDQILVTPIRPPEFLVGKLVPYVLLGLLNVAVVLAVGRFWFGVPMRGSVALLYALSGLFLLSTLGAGLFAASISRSQQQAMLTCMAFVTPNMLLSGFIFPIENMPAAIQGLTYVMPLRYFLVIIRGILLKGVGLTILWTEVLALAGFGVAIFLASLVAFRRGTAR